VPHTAYFRVGILQMDEQGFIALRFVFSILIQELIVLGTFLFLPQFFHHRLH
jgi:hypothetical protein